MASNRALVSGLREALAGRTKSDREAKDKTSCTRCRVLWAADLEKSSIIWVNGGGESVSQSPLKHKTLLPFLGPNPPFELTGNWRFVSNLFVESIVGHTRGTGIDVYDLGLVYPEFE